MIPLRNIEPWYLNIEVTQRLIREDFILYGLRRQDVTTQITDGDHVPG